MEGSGKILWLLPVTARDFWAVRLENLGWPTVGLRPNAGSEYKMRVHCLWLVYHPRAILHL